jgi:hypothetical protein
MISQMTAKSRFAAERTVSAGEFKAKRLRRLDCVVRTRKPIHQARQANREAYAYR